MAAILLQLLLSIFLSCLSNGANVIKVSTSCEGSDLYSASSNFLSNGSSCTDLDTANLTNNTELVLLAGNHLLTKVWEVRDLANVTISGVRKGEVFVSCTPYVGLWFAEIRNLTIANVTISSCGLSGQHLGELKSEITRLFVPKIYVNETSNCSVMVIGCREFTMKDVVVRENSGLGMLIINAMDSLVLSRLTVSGNGIGGVYLLYANYVTGQESHEAATRVDINECTFSNNTNTEISPLLYIESVGIQQSFVGGGLAVNLIQSSFPVNVSIVQSMFDSNEAVYGGGVYLGAFTCLYRSSVHFNNCTFQRNCIDCTSNLGGGLYVALGLPDPCALRSSELEIIIETSLFTGNQALDGGALYMLALQPTSAFSSIAILVSVFRENIGSRASAIALYHEALPYQQEPTFLASLKNCTIQNNFQTETNSVLATATAVSAQDGKLLLDESNHVLSNEGTGLTCINCQVQIKGDNVFAENTGTHGGGMYLSSGILVLFDGSELSFNNNTATVAGGAIFVQEIAERGVIVADNCFINADQSYNYDNCSFRSDTDFHTLISLHGNSAPISSMIHGSSLTSCSWISNPTDFYRHQYSTCNNTELFSFDADPVGITEVSSQSVTLQITANLSSLIPIPGQEFDISVSSLDIYNQSIPDVITFHTLGDGVVTSWIANSNFWSLDGRNDTIPLVINATENATVEIELLSTLSLARNVFTIQLGTCSLGLFYNESERSCECDERFQNLDFSCSIQGGVIFKTLSGLWLGEGEGDLKNMLLWGHCPKYYCEEELVNIVAYNFSIQCPNGTHRTGLLCGKCKENMSAVLGTSTKCVHCSNTSLAVLLVVLIIGILMIFTLTLFHFSISEGYLNSILFYCNVLSIYGGHFVPINEWNIIFIVADFLSLKLNFNLCLYDGMTQSVVVLIQYLFVLYIFILMWIAYKVASKFSLPAASTYSPSKTAATLLVLCYMSLLDSCVQSLSFVRLYNLDGHVVTTRWRGDPSLPYFTGLHGLLVVSAVMVIVFILFPFTVIVIFPRLPYRVPGLAKLKPVYDALWAPFKPETRSWLGFRLIVRWVLFICAFTLDSRDSIFALGLVLTFLLFIQSIVQPFAKVTGNRLDNSLIMLVILLAFGVNYANWAHFNAGGFLLTYSIIITTFFYSGIIMIFSINFHAQYPNLLAAVKKCFVTLKGRCCPTREERQNLLEEEVVPEPTSTEVSIADLKKESSCEMVIAGLKEDSDLRQAEVVSTEGNPVPNVITIATDATASPQDLPSTSQDEATHQFDTGESDRFHTCRSTDSQEPIELYSQ